MDVRARWLVVLLSVAGCTNDGNGPNKNDAAMPMPDLATGPLAPVKLQGAVQKGPFVLGSSIAVSAVDATGNPTGQVFNTMTTDDLGEFELDVAYRGVASIEGTGFYYNEVTGALSTANLTLRAFYEVTDGGTQKAYVNLLTHLVYGRVKALLGSGGDGGAGAADDGGASDGGASDGGAIDGGASAVGAAVAQAEGELRRALTIGGPAFAPQKTAVQTNLLGGDDDDDAYLFAVSAILAQIAHDTAGGNGVDATLQELINTISSSFAASGQLDPTVVAEIQKVQQTVDPQTIMDMLATRLTMLHSTAVVPDLNRVWDTDGDGVPNAKDNCPLIANPDQSPVNGVCRYKVSYMDFSMNTQVAIGDLNGDGNADLFSFGSGTMQVFPGDGTGALGFPQATQVSPLPMAVMTPPGGGLKQPLVIDYATATQHPKVYGDSGFDSNNNPWNVELDDDGAGHFTGGLAPSLGITDSGTLYNGFSRFVLADFTGDGYDDRVGTLGAGSVVYGLMTNGAVNPPTTAQIPLPTPSPSPSPAPAVHAIAAGDLNHDGHPDLILGEDAQNGPGGGVLVLLSNHSTTAPFFTAQPLVTSAGMNVDALAVCDIDNDGNADLIVNNVTNPVQLVALKGDGSGTNWSAPIPIGAASIVYCADVTGDKKADVLAIVDGVPSVFVSNGGSFATPSKIPVALTNQVFDFAVGDFNKDGKADLVVVSMDPKMLNQPKAAVVLINP